MKTAGMCALETPLPVEDLEGLLKQSLGPAFKIKHVTWKYLTDPGENFGSLILAVTVSVTENSSLNTLNIVVKLPPTSAYLLDLFNSSLTFEKELCFYRDIVPVLMDLHKSALHEQELNNFAPRFFGGRLGLKNSKEFDSQAAIILENLTSSSYSVQDRIMGLDIGHVKFAVKELAKLHAMVICLKIKRRDFFENTVLPALKPPANETAKKCVMDMIQKAYADIKNLEEAKPYLESIEKTLHCTDDESTKFDQQKELWATLVHNDFWVNNMMFCYDSSGHVSGMKIVDFQLCIYDYGVQDLIFFLISSSKKEIIDNNLDEVIDLYYDSFVNFLNKLGVDTKQYTRNKFLELLNKCAPTKFPQCIMMVQVIQASRISSSEIKNMDNKEKLLQRETNNIGNQKLLHIVETFAKRKWLLK
ncbi:hypothetical protein KPH14_009448 [Odynerus spinipes]|uniref:CHK kinase-like domain-containing protein n=1 Tax=Odynerus spinipes TaxID=1348599 RepID=A0AAD9RPV1_9HYME|nr:hypothetical protein KPH14_009448 [Odynerus spinipes]